MGADILGILIAAVVVFFLVRVALNTEARAERNRALAAQGRKWKVPPCPVRPKCHCPECYYEATGRLSPAAVRANRAAWLTAQRRQGR
jgi:hypothetical protein